MTQDFSQLMPLNFSHVLTHIGEQVRAQPITGKVASCIPELAKVSPEHFALTLYHVDGSCHTYGEADVKFSVQSIAKAFSLAMVYGRLGEDVWSRLGVEPSGDPFNSLAQLEFENGIPRNPFINAGALVIADILVSHWVNPKMAFLNFVQQLVGHERVDFNPQVARSEATHGHRNAALAHLMKSFGNLHNPVEVVLDFYFNMCSLELTTSELARAFLVFANCGQLPEREQSILTFSQTQRLNAIMQTCGFYDESGDYSFRVGLPGKSGVGGGVAAVCPEQYSVAAWSPALNAKGNSVRGIAALELLTTYTASSIF
jgi:glutaminase